MRTSTGLAHEWVLPPPQTVPKFPHSGAVWASLCAIRVHAPSRHQVGSTGPPCRGGGGGQVGSTGPPGGGGVGGQRLPSAWFSGRSRGQLSPGPRPVPADQCVAWGRSLRPRSLSPTWGVGEPLAQVTGQSDDTLTEQQPLLPTVSVPRVSVNLGSESIEGKIPEINHLCLNRMLF